MYGERCRYRHYLLPYEKQAKSGKKDEQHAEHQGEHQGKQDVRGRLVGGSQGNEQERESGGVVEITRKEWEDTNRRLDFLEWQQIVRHPYT